MSKVFDELEQNELMRHIILTKLYINSKGAIHVNYDGNLSKEIEFIYGDKFDQEVYRNAFSFCKRHKYISNNNMLKPDGVDYFENWLKYFDSIPEEKRKSYLERLSEKSKGVVELIKGTNSAISILEFFLKAKGD